MRHSKESLDATLPENKCLKAHVIFWYNSWRLKIFSFRYGYQVVEGYEVESIIIISNAWIYLKDHPARDMQDKFYFRWDVNSYAYLPVQARQWKTRFSKGALRMISPGKYSKCRYRWCDIVTNSIRLKALLLIKMSQWWFKRTLEVMMKNVWVKIVKLFMSSYFLYRTFSQVDVNVLNGAGQGAVCKHRLDWNFRWKWTFIQM